MGAYGESSKRHWPYKSNCFNHLLAPLSNLFSLRGRRGSPSGRQVSTPKRVPARHRHGEGTTRAHKNHRDASRPRQGEPATGGACRGRMRRMPLKISNGPRKQRRAAQFRNNMSSFMCQFSKSGLIQAASQPSCAMATFIDAYSTSSKIRAPAPATHIRDSRIRTIFRAEQRDTRREATR